MTYQQAAEWLGEKQASSNRFWVKDLTQALNESGKRYTSSHVKSGRLPKPYKDGSIVLIRRSKHYPVGHYLIVYNQQWMDPWINLPSNRDISEARSGFRKQLPGKVIYIISPDEDM